MSAAGDWSAFWTGPGQWMVMAPYVSHEDISHIVKTGLADTASVTEQTDGWVRFDIEGPRSMDMFERLSNVDVRTMKAGQATRTQVEHLGSFLLCHSAGTRFSLITLRSGADSPTAPCSGDSGQKPRLIVTRQACEPDAGPSPALFMLYP